MVDINTEFKMVEEIQQLDELTTYIYSILVAQRCKERFQLLAEALTANNNGPNFAMLIKPETLWTELKVFENHKQQDTELPLK